jgi:hypothetical protein
MVKLASQPEKQGEAIRALLKVRTILAQQRNNLYSLNVYFQQAVGI